MFTKRLLFLLLLIPRFGFSYFDEIFSGDEEFSHFHHVNVITGHFNFPFQDALILGAKPIPILRNYSSSGALEKTYREYSDLYYKSMHHGWIIQGGWSLFPHEHLLLETCHKRENDKVYSSEPNGSRIIYVYSHKKAGTKHTIVFKPTCEISQFAGKLGRRINPQNNCLEIDLKEGVATLFLPNGGSRIYRILKSHPYEKSKEFRPQHFYFLSEERLPSGHLFRYQHDKETHLRRVESRNPAGTKLYAAVDIEYIRPSKKSCEFQLNLRASDGKFLHYGSICHERRTYLNEFSSNFRPHEKADLISGRKGIGARMRSIDVGGQVPFRVTYYLPDNQSQERKWAEKPEQVEFHIDKVKEVFEPVGPKGEEVRVALFTYRPNQTDVRDTDNLLIRYTYDSERFNLIEYFDEKDQLCSFQKFYWQGTELCCKAIFDAKQQPLFAKTFAYQKGNVVEEVLWGYFTGEKVLPLQITSEGKPFGGENYRKTYTYYDDACNLIQTESEEEGPTYKYSYRLGTDLCTAKLTKDKKGNILVREFFSYDDDHFLIQEIIDDGTSLDSQNTQNVTERLEKRYERNSSSLVDWIIESYWNSDSKTQKLLKKTKYTYENQRVKTEEVYDALGKKRYCLEIDYDSFGFIKRKTTPLGRENTYVYNSQGCLQESKEVGSPRKIFHYDKANRCILCEQPDTGKTATTHYDAKGRAVMETDFRGNRTIHTYDCFGNRISSNLPVCRDEEGKEYIPIPKFEYDVQNNLIASEMPRGERRKTSYNIFRKPTLIIQADGTHVQHFYNKMGSLSKTLFEDGTEIDYEYDLFQRLTAKKIFSKEHQLLASESWEYGSFRLLSHTDSRGLMTRFIYDGAGRKIAEEAEGRKTTFSYDTLGFQEKRDDGIVALFQKRNQEGLVEKQWEKDSFGRIENHMFFFYDAENRKIKVIRETSQGSAEDRLTYDRGSKLAGHTDPNGALTQWVYNEFFENDLGQKVLQKTTIDPLGLSAVETYDAAERLILKEKKDLQGQTVFKETFFYDRSGHRVKQIDDVYEGNRLIKQIPIVWEYDAMGRVIRETQSGQKSTAFDYDLRGRLNQKHLPSGTNTHFIYDGADRLEEIFSADGRIRYRYFYEKGPDPIQILDLAQGVSLKRAFNLFGQVISETNARELTSRWAYDAVGRCIAFTLPNGSSIHYATQGGHITAVQRKNPLGEPLYEHTYTKFDVNGHVAEEELIDGLGPLKTMHDLLERPIGQSCKQMQDSASYGLSGLIQKTTNSLFGEKTYEYDALNQLVVEGDQTHPFDSLGNPTAFAINDLNQITMTSDCTLNYDLDGNLKEKVSKDDPIQYEFDPFGRLTGITVSDKKRIRYSYDPLSRLFAKETELYKQGAWQHEQKVFYLYDRGSEIGIQDEGGNLLELKVLGLGIKGDIGAAVAIELKRSVYAPLHDLNGNIIAILSSDGAIAEQYEIDAFGKEKKKASLNPWRFSSKRSEEALVFFGLRFYDPALGRWLSPDPAGFIEGANLYAYVQNSPLNRLDLFGLLSDGIRNPFGELSTEIPIRSEIIPFDSSLFSIRIAEGGIWVDYFLSCGHWHELKLSSSEEEAGVFNLLDHGELFSAANGQIGLVTFSHGVNVKKWEFEEVCNYMVKNLPSQPLFIGRYYGTDGLVKDTCGAMQELCRIETVQVCQARQFLLTCSEALHRVNPAKFDDAGNLSLGAMWAHYNHSRGGVIDLRALQSAPYEQQKILQTQLLLTSVAPAMPLPMHLGHSIINYYSAQDFFTGGFGAPHVLAGISFGAAGYVAAKSKWDHSDCDIRFVPCTSKWSERSFYVADHAVLGGTYRGIIEDSIKENNKTYGFYGGKNR